MADKKPYEKSCLMLDFKIDNWSELLNKVSDEKIYNDETNDFGKENEPHCTVLYGFNQGKEIVEQVKDICERIKTPVSVKVKSISCFESGEFDVLKFDLESESLVKLNSIFATFDVTNDFPDYHAHMTIAYLKKGVVKNPKTFKIDLSDKNLVIEGNSFTFSVKGTRNKVKFTNDKINNLIKGGKGDFAFIDDFSLEELKDGLKVESEHTDNIAEALEIVLDHLTENKEYYVKLKDAGLADELDEAKINNKKWYHGSDYKFTTFQNFESKGPSALGFFATDDINLAELFGQYVYDVSVNYTNPYKITISKWNSIRDKHARNTDYFINLRNELINKGYDSVFIKGQVSKMSNNVTFKDGDIVIIFDKNNIKVNQIINDK